MENNLYTTKHTTYSTKHTTRHSRNHQHATASVRHARADHARHDRAHPNHHRFDEFDEFCELRAWFRFKCRASGRLGYSRELRARSRSAMMSSTVSMPTESLITSSPAPAALRCSVVSWRCVVEAGWSIKERTSPRLARWLSSWHRSTARTHPCQHTAHTSPRALRPVHDNCILPPLAG